MPDLTIWVSGADFIEIRSCLASEGSNVLKLVWLKSVLDPLLEPPTRRGDLRRVSPKWP